MALITCHECNQQVSTEAKSCPGCGAKVKKSIGWIGFAGVLFFIATIATCIDHKNQNASAVQPSSTAISNGLEKPPSDAASIATNDVASTPPTPKWEYQNQTDPMNGASISFASVTSINSHDLHWPYGKGVKATLVLQKHKKRGLNVYVRIGSGQILCRSFSPCRLPLRFDSSKGIFVSGTGSADGDAKYVFLSGASLVLTKLKSAKRLLIELPLYQDGNRVFEFDVANLDWK